MDWKQLLKELREADWTQQRIAERCNVSQSTVSELGSKDDREPSYSFGQALVELHRRAVKGKKTKTTDAPSAAVYERADGRLIADTRNPLNAELHAAIPSRRASDRPQG